MENTLDLSRWKERPCGLLYRWWTIISYGLQQELRTRLFRLILSTAWVWGLCIAVLGFVFSQSFSGSNWIQSMASYFGPRVQASATAANALVLLFPELWIGGFFNLLLMAHSFLALFLSLIALTALTPRLLSQDRASNALILYLSRPLTSTDYLIGKFGIIVGVLTLIWTGPLLVGWLLSVAFAPDPDFFTYSLSPVLKALSFNGIALFSLAPIALGVSSITRSSRSTIMLWIGLWLIVGAFGKSSHAPRWMQRASFSRNLSEVREGLFRADQTLTDAAANIPFAPEAFTQKLKQLGISNKTTDFQGALLSLGLMSLISSCIFFRKLRTE